MQELGLTPDPWQAEYLRCEDDRVLLLCSRQVGKSTTTAVKALHKALYHAGSLTLLVSPTERQSKELFIKLTDFYKTIDSPVVSVQETALILGLSNGSRVVSLPCNPDGIRGFSSVDLLVIDEASRTPDALFISVKPMLAVSRGQLVALTTGRGKRGWFYEAWEGLRGERWRKFRATAYDCPRYSAEFLEEEKLSMGERHFNQEYGATFEDTEDQVFSTESVLAAFDTDTPPLFEGLALG